MNHLATLIKTHRKAAGLNQTQLADLAGVGKTLIFDLEHGKMSVRLDKLMAVLKTLNIEFQLNSPLKKVTL